VPAWAVEISDKFNGFNGYTLESPVTNYPAMKLLETWSADYVKEVGVYVNPGEVLTLNGVTFTRIHYRFADGRLESIQLRYEGERDQRDKLLQWLEEHYCKLTPGERRTLAQVEWHGPNLSITLSYNVFTKKGLVMFVAPLLHLGVHDSANAMAD